MAAVSPRREGGGCNDDRTLALCGFVTTLLLGLLGGSPGSPTGPVTDGIWFCCSRVCGRSGCSAAVCTDGAMVVVVLEDAGRLSEAPEGKGSVSRKVGKADISDISLAEGEWVGLEGAMVCFSVALRCSYGRRLRLGVCCLTVWSGCRGSGPTAIAQTS